MVELWYMWVRVPYVLVTNSPPGLIMIIGNHDLWELVLPSGVDPMLMQAPKLVPP